MFKLLPKFCYNCKQLSAEFRFEIRTNLQFIKLTIQLSRIGSLTPLTLESIFRISLWVQEQPPFPPILFPILLEPCGRDYMDRIALLGKNIIV
jgi:hypothetical protein